MDRIVCMGELLVEMECPVCMEFMHPPIRQCLAGHSFCFNCHPRLKKCPTCRMSLYHTTRSIVLERLHSKMLFPCKYRENGCTSVEPGSRIQFHEYHCPSGGTICPLHELNNCEWMGRPRDYLQHCNEAHPNNMFCADEQRLTCTNFLRDLQSDTATTTSFYIFFNTHDEFFKCAWEINYENGFMRWCVFRVDQGPENNNLYEYTVEFSHPSDDTRRVTVRATCPSIVIGNPVQFQDAHCLMVHYDMVKDFCKGNDLHYVVKIHKLQRFFS